MLHIEITVSKISTRYRLADEIRSFRTCFFFISVTVFDSVTIIFVKLFLF